MHQPRRKTIGEVTPAFSAQTKMSACTGTRAHPLRSSLTKPRRLVACSHPGRRLHWSAALLPCFHALLARRLGGAALGKGGILHAVKACVRTDQRPRDCCARRTAAPRCGAAASHPCDCHLDEVCECIAAGEIIEQLVVYHLRPRPESC